MPGLITVGVPYVTEAYAPQLGARAMGYYMSALVAGGLIGRVGVALLTAATSWRLALGLLALLPLVSVLLMRSGLPPEEPGLRRTTRLSLPDAARVLRSRELLAATLAGSLLFFAFQGAFSYIGFRLEREPFSLSDGATGLVFLVWAIGAIGPTAGRIADRRGWSIVALAGLATAAAGIGLSLAHVLPLILLGLALVTLGNFGGITAAQLGVASSTESDRGLASALYFSSYYVAGALGAWAPGLAWQRGAGTASPCSASAPTRSGRRRCCSRAVPGASPSERGRTARRPRARRARWSGRAASSAPRGRGTSGRRTG